MKQPLPRILLIYTGGTIGMIKDPSTGALKPFDFKHLLDNVPKMKLLGYDFGSVQFQPPIDSSNMNPSHWVSIAKAIADNYRLYDGFVVLHGTDTMAFTASALSFMLKGLNKPVVLTGSQLPIGDVRQDGAENLITACMIAAAKENDGITPIVKETVISFENYLLRGNRSTKMSSTNFRAFRSFNYPALATMDLHINFHPEFMLQPSSDSILEPQYSMDSGIGVLYLFPGIPPEFVESQLMAKGIHSVVLRSFGAGNAPTEQWFIDMISKAVENGMTIVNVTQCVNGGDEQKRYYTGEMLAEAGVTSGYDITCEAALTKLMYLGAKGLRGKELAEAFSIPICGEMTVE